MTLCRSRMRRQRQAFRILTSCSPSFRTSSFPPVSVRTSTTSWLDLKQAMWRHVSPDCKTERETSLFAQYTITEELQQAWGLPPEGCKAKAGFIWFISIQKKNQKFQQIFKKPSESSHYILYVSVCMFTYTYICRWDVSYLVSEHQQLLAAYCSHALNQLLRGVLIADSSH